MFSLLFEYGVFVKPKSGVKSGLKSGHPPDFTPDFTPDFKPDFATKPLFENRV